MKKYYVTVEDSTLAYTSSRNYGCVGHRFVRLGVEASCEQSAHVEALKIVSGLHQTPADFLSIATD